MLNLPMLICKIVRRLKMYDNLANFDKETEKVCKSGNRVWISGRFWPGDWKSMKNWPILRTRLNKYESLAILLTRWLKKYENLASEVLPKFHTFSVMCMEHFSCLPNSHTFSVSFSELLPWYCNYNIDKERDKLDNQSNVLLIYFQKV